VSTPPAVDIVMVNWNIGRPLRDCVAALAGARHQCYSLGQVIVVDNASSDGSATDLHAAGLPLFVIRNADNRGFAAACNQGAARCSADYLLFLNPDTAVLGETLARPSPVWHGRRARVSASSAYSCWIGTARSRAVARGSRPRASSWRRCSD
jgi:glycosyltransferase involved in cell wall biosynthesis